MCGIPKRSIVIVSPGIARVAAITVRNSEAAMFIERSDRDCRKFCVSVRDTPRDMAWI